MKKENNPKLILNSQTNLNQNLKKPVKSRFNTIKKVEQGITKGVKKVENITLHPILNNYSKRTFGQKAADSLAKWAGSWAFIISFLIFLILWMMINVYGWVNKWDPYPFILLNLVLSCLAAIQAPVILMSQNRESQRDRQRAEYDYQVNRKAEREIQEIKKQLSRIEKKVSSLKNPNNI